MLDTIKVIESLTKNLDNPENRRTLMREYGDFPEMLFGVNEIGEDTHISINSDNIVVVTYQHNGYIRTDIYYDDGTLEELYERGDD